MKKKIFIFGLLLFCLTTLMWVASYAQSFDLYVMNVPFKGSSMVIMGKAYVEINDFLNSMRFNWKQEGNKVEVFATLPVEYIPSNPVNGSNLSFVFNGNEFKPEQLVENGKTYYKLTDLAPKFNAYVVYNPVSQICDVVYIRTAIASDVEKAKQLSAPVNQDTEAKTDEAKTDDAAAKDEIIKASIDYNQDSNPSMQAMGAEFRGTISVQNTVDLAVEDVKVTWTVKTEDGATLHTEDITIGKMNPKELKTQDVYWMNPNPMLPIKVTVTPKYTKPQGLEEKAKEETKPTTGIPQVPPEGK